MYNYHAGLAWRIDIALLGLLLFLYVSTIFYAALKSYFENLRTRGLLNIKKNIYELVLAKKTPAEDVCLPIVTGSTVQQFVDVATNRIRDVVFFNDSEQKLFRECFATPEKLHRLGKVAKRLWGKWRRIEAIISLGYSGDPFVLPILEKTISDRDRDIAYFSMVALGQIKTIGAAKILLEFLKKRPFARYKVASILEGFPASITDEVIKLTEDSDPSLRFWAIKLTPTPKNLVWGFMPERHMKRIEGLTTDESDDVRAAACECLGNLGRKDAMPALSKCLNDEVWYVRMHAVRALSKVLGKESIPHVITLIGDNSLYVIDSVKAVMSEHIEESLPFIEKFLYGKDDMAKKASIEALDTSGYITKVLRNVISQDDKERLRAIHLLEGMIRSHAHSGLETAMADFTPEEREKILKVIKNLDEGLSVHIDKRLKQEPDGL